MDSSRIRFLRERWLDAAVHGLARIEKAPIDPDPLWRQLLSLDPSPRKRYLNWVCQQVAAGQLKREDFYKVPEALAELSRVAPILRREGVSRDINQYPTLPALNAALMPYVDSRTQAELDTNERADIDAETKFHFRDPALMVVEPLSERSACFWGRGTRWCTAASNTNNPFQDYAKEGHRFLIFMLADGSKFQGCTNGEFADAADSPIGLESVDLPFPWAHDDRLIDLALQIDGALIRYLPSQHRTLDRCLAAVRSSPDDALPHLSKAERLPEVCLAAVRQDGTSIRHLADDDRTVEICLAAVRQDPWSIEHLSHAQRTNSVCSQAVSLDGDALDRLTDDEKTYQLCVEAVANRGCGVQHVHDHRRTPALCLLAVRRSGAAVFHLNSEQRTQAICLAAVHQNASAFIHLDSEQRTEAVCLVVARKAPWLIGHFSSDERTPAVCLAACRSAGGIIASLPTEKRTTEVCLAAVESKPSAVMMLTESQQTEEVLDAVLASYAVEPRAQPPQQPTFA